MTSPEADPHGAAAAGTARLERAVRAAEQALIEYEIAVDTFRIEVENFSRLHHQKLGPMYTRPGPRRRAQERGRAAPRRVHPQPSTPRPRRWRRAGRGGRAPGRG